MFLLYFILFYFLLFYYSPFPLCFLTHFFLLSFSPVLPFTLQHHHHHHKQRPTPPLLSHCLPAPLHSYSSVNTPSLPSAVRQLQRHYAEVARQPRLLPSPANDNSQGDNEEVCDWLKLQEWGKQEFSKIHPEHARLAHSMTLTSQWESRKRGGVSPWLAERAATDVNM